MIQSWCTYRRLEFMECKRRKKWFTYHLDNHDHQRELEFGWSKVYIWAKWPIRPELIPVSVAWSDWEYFYSPPLNGMLVHRKTQRCWSKIILKTFRGQVTLLFVCVCVRCFYLFIFSFYKFFTHDIFKKQIREVVASAKFPAPLLTFDFFGFI